MKRLLYIILIFLGTVIPFRKAMSQEICAQVRIEIRQELAFERQAFDAKMRINNSLTNIPITDLSITVWAKDQNGLDVPLTNDPNGFGAAFFIRIDSMTDVNNVSGTGVINPATAAEIHWLLIPTAGASAGLTTGKLYYVGAKVSYKFSGELHEIDVPPDTITVMPQPELALDYFLTKNIRADDPLTTAIEPIEPYVLGVRIKNTGLGGAKNISIDSAQPKIIENRQGLLIGFRITESSINDEPANPSLLIKFGNIGPNESKMGRWTMESTLTGEFVSFTARFVHSDQLGGALTSLLTSVATHFHMRDVIVDLPGRDSIRDFLASNDGFIKVYESQGLDTTVTDHSNSASLVLIGTSQGVEEHRLNFPNTAGPVFVSVTDTSAGKKQINSVIRSDGKEIPLDNAWFSASGQAGNTKYQFNLFDVNGGGNYTVKMQGKASNPRPPVLQFIPDRSLTEGRNISFMIAASDPDGTTPTLSLDTYPSGATFVDNGNGSAFFDWRPKIGQRGVYPLTFRASDGSLSSSRNVTLKVYTAGDNDNDDMNDAWEIFFFGNINRNGTLDADGDGVSDKVEFQRNSDPTFARDIPSVPVIVSPLDGSRVTVINPALKVLNSSHGKKEAWYDFEIYKDTALRNLVVSNTIAETNLSTEWKVNNLADNTKYFWRARARTDYSISEWVRGNFVLNTVNDAPSPFTIDQPTNGVSISTLKPVLSLRNTTDPDGDVVTYGFEVREQGTAGPVVASIANLAQNNGGITSWQVPINLNQDTQYFWRGIAKDTSGLTTNTPWASFIPSLENNGPDAPIPFYPTGGILITASSVDITTRAAHDPENDPLRYLFEIDVVSSFNSPLLKRSGLIPELNGQAKMRHALIEDQTYYWRVKAFDFVFEGPWSPTSQFHVNVQNQAPGVPTIDNPGMGAFIATLTPTLRLNAATDSDNEPVSYIFEIFNDENLTTLVQTKVVSDTFWALTVPLQDNTRYYWRARAIDSHSAKGDWTDVHNFFVDYDNVNDAPSITLISAQSASITTEESVQIRWGDSDPDSNASVSLYANDTLIANGISEDLEGEADSFTWKAAGAGQYKIKAVIADEQSSVESVGGTLTVTQAVSDKDGDGIEDKADNCPYFGNPDQKDRGGLSIKKKDSIGDACQCGDVNGDGMVNAKDSALIKKAMQKGSKVKVPRLDLCDLDNTKSCTVKDASVIDAYLKKMTAHLKKPGKKAKPVLPQVCGETNF